MECCSLNTTMIVFSIASQQLIISVKSATLFVLACDQVEQEAASEAPDWLVAVFGL